jgi:peptide/nickel transport system substrate-binding protein
MTRRTLTFLFVTGALHLLALFVFTATLHAQTGGELRFCLRADPKTFDPLLVEDDVSEAVRYMTGGVLLRVDRKTQQLMPELATSWKVDDQGRRITFDLRPGMEFSDGTPFTTADVAYTIARLMDPNTHSATADPFRSSSASPQIATSAPNRISITFGAPVSGLDRLFDQVAIVSQKSPKGIAAVLGPFMVSEYKAGSELTLARNPHYWKHDASGRQLPYLERVRLSIQQNRDLELLRFRRGEVDLINALDADAFEYLAKQQPNAVIDAGPSLDSEQIWFNQKPSSPLPAYKKAWFASKEFRNAVSMAIDRDALAKVIYHGHARPAAGPISPRIVSGSTRSLARLSIMTPPRSNFSNARASRCATARCKIAKGTRWNSQ